MKTKVELSFGKNAKFTGFGLKGCSHGMYSGGYNFYVYGIKWLFNLTVDRRWGDWARR